jgi:predicted enzyme related to lactoylglutathione lyase
MARIVHFEIGGTDKTKAAEFYGAIFGWTFPEMGPATMIEGAGLTGHLNALGREPHNYVLIYVGVDDIRETLRRSSEHGGKTLIGPHEIPTGTFAWIQDPTGTIIGLWQAAKPAQALTSAGGAPGEGGGAGPFERLRRAFAGLDLGDADVELDHEGAASGAGLEGGAADHGGDPLADQLSVAERGGGQGEGEDL